MGFGLRVVGLKGEKTLYHSTVVETEARASKEALQAQDKEDKGLVCFLEWATRDSKSFTANVRAEITNEALAAEASKYNFFPFVFGGNRDIFSSTPSYGYDRALVLGEFSGLGGVDAVEGVDFQDPLSVVLIDGSSWVMETDEEKSLVEIRVREEVDKPEFDETLQERKVFGSS